MVCEDMRGSRMVDDEEIGDEMREQILCLIN